MTKLAKVFINSNQRDPPVSKDEYDYVVNLNKHYTHVFAIDLTNLNIPFDVTPSFYPANPIYSIIGNNKIDFSLVNGVLGTQTFSVTMPTKYYFFESEENPSHSYIDTLVALMNLEISNNAIFKNKVKIIKWPSYNYKTYLQIQTCGYPDGSTLPPYDLDTDGDGIPDWYTIWPPTPLYPSTQLKFLFQSGVNSASSAYSQMGFLKLDYSSSPSVTVIDKLAQFIESPLPTSLILFPYIDIWIPEISTLNPVFREYVPSERYSILKKMMPIRRIHFQCSKPIPKLPRIHIRLTISKNKSPIIYGIDRNLSHEITFLPVQLSNEDFDIPSYMKQFFLL